MPAYDLVQLVVNKNPVYDVSPGLYFRFANDQSRSDPKEASYTPYRVTKGVRDQF